MTRLTENRAVAQLAQKLGVASRTSTTFRRRVGNHSPTMFPDLFNAKVNDQRAVDQVDLDWYENEYNPARRQARCGDHRSALAHRRRIGRQRCDRLHARLGAGSDDLRSMAVRSGGEYALEEGLMSSFPLRLFALRDRPRPRGR